MVQNSSVDAIKRSLDERFRQLATDLDAVIGAIATNPNGAERMGPLKKLVEASRDLHDYLAENDRPQWLRGCP